VRSVLFDHIAIAVPRLAEAEAVLAGELGGRSTFGMTTEEYRFWHWRYEGPRGTRARGRERLSASLHRAARPGHPPRHVHGAEPRRGL
jgi:hypothetical protein